MYVDGNTPVLHIVDEATRYQSGRIMAKITAKDVWDALRVYWIDAYLGPPDWITTDAGKQLASKDSRQFAANMGTQVKIVPLEAHNSIGLVERYHGHLIRRRKRRRNWGAMNWLWEVHKRFN